MKLLQVLKYNSSCANKSLFIMYSAHLIRYDHWKKYLIVAPNNASRWFRDNNSLLENVNYEVTGCTKVC